MVKLTIMPIVIYIVRFNILTLPLCAFGTYFKTKAIGLKWRVGTRNLDAASEQFEMMGWRI